jgi:nucleoid-associated protein YgaU
VFLRRAYRAFVRIATAPLADGQANRVRLLAALIGVALLPVAVYGASALVGGGSEESVVAVQSTVTARATVARTPRPSLSPTAVPTPEPTIAPTPEPVTPPPVTAAPIAAPTPAPTPEPTPPSGPPCGGPPFLAWVWHFGTDGTPQQIASKLAANRAGVIVKTHLGTEWMAGTQDPTSDAVTGPERVAELARLFESNGVPFHAYAVVKGTDPVLEAQMAASVLGAGARSLFIDLEPYSGYWQGTPEGALAFGAELRRLQPGATVVTAIDPRPWWLGGIPLKEFASFSNALAPLIYWETFDSPGTRDGYAAAGYPPPGEITPEFLLDITSRLLAPYGLPLMPVGQGTSDATQWARFIGHATAAGMPEQSVWRHGVTSADVWPVLAERTPSGQQYVVASGDTLSLIARLWGVDANRIAVANRLANPNALHVGQVLCIPTR